MRVCLHFNTNLYTYLAPVKFLASFLRRSFCVGIDNSALRYYFELKYIILFYSSCISACDLVSTVVCLWSQKVNLRTCEDRVKEN